MNLPLQPALRPADPRWRRLVAVLLLLAAVLALGWTQQARQRPARVLLSSVDAREIGVDDYAGTLIRLVDRARERVWVMMYVARLDDGPGAGIAEALVRAHRRGVDVRVVLDRSIAWGTDEIDPKHREPAGLLRSQGIAVVVDDLARRSHAKLVLIDDAISITGSHNWTRSALTTNHEASVLAHDPHLVSRFEPMFFEVPGFPPR